MVRLVCVAFSVLLLVGCNEAAPLPFSETSGGDGTGAGGGSNGGGSTGGGGLFGGLSGTYELDDGCLLVLNGSTGAADCSESDADEWGSWVDEYDVDVTIQETRISATLENRYNFVDTFTSDPWNDSYDYVGTATATAIRSSGRQGESGRFAAIAGTWTGEVVWTETWVDYYDGPDENADSGIVSFRAEVFGGVIEVSWTTVDDQGSFSVTSTPSGVFVDGEFAREL